MKTDLRIALDAGHGATAKLIHTGAAANGLVEDEVALDMVTRIGHHLRIAGHQTVFTRPDEKKTSLASRGKTAVAEKCQLFLSIHCNAGPENANGVEAFVAGGDGRSVKLADALVASIAAKGMHSRGVKKDSQSQYSSLRVLRDTYKHMPAVLLEVGFLTSPKDSLLLKDKHFRETISIGIAEALTC